MISLIIQHNIYLTKEERYKLHNGGVIETIGVSIPVWINKIKDLTVTKETEKEVFCRYVIKNPKDEIPIKFLNDGYEVLIPYRLGKTPEISNEEWQELSKNNPEKLEKILSKRVREISSKNLLDIEDGGGRHLFYREYDKVDVGDKTYRVTHYIKIKSMEELEESLTLL